MVSQNDERIAALEARVSHLESLRALNTETDEAVESALRDRLPLENTLIRAAVPLFAHTGGHTLWVRTYDENLELRDFVEGSWDAFDEETRLAIGDAALASGTFERARDKHTIVGQRLDVAGESSGAAAICIDGVLDEDARARALEHLDVWCEELDN